MKVPRFVAWGGKIPPPPTLPSLCNSFGRYSQRFQPLLWPWPWGQQAKSATKHCSCLVAKDSKVQEIYNSCILRISARTVTIMVLKILSGQLYFPWAFEPSLWPRLQQSKIVTQHWLMMMHHYTMFGSKRFKSSRFGLAFQYKIKQIIKRMDNGNRKLNRKTERAIGLGRRTKEEI